MRLKPGESSDSGFCSSPVLTTQVFIIFVFISLRLGFAFQFVHSAKWLVKSIQ